MEATQDGSSYGASGAARFVGPALAASKGEKVAAFVDTGVNTITKENMASARSQELLNPKVK